LQFIDHLKVSFAWQIHNNLSANANGAPARAEFIFPIRFDTEVPHTV